MKTISEERSRGSVDVSWGGCTFVVVLCFPKRSFPPCCSAAVCDISDHHAPTIYHQGEGADGTHRTYFMLGWNFHCAGLVCGGGWGIT